MIRLVKIETEIDVIFLISDLKKQKLTTSNAEVNERCLLDLDYVIKSYYKVGKQNLITT